MGAATNRPQSRNPRPASQTILSLLLLCGAHALASEPEEAGEVRPDYSVCKTCDVHDAEDPEVRHFAGMIAETRWAMQQRDTGVMVIRNDAGDKGHWRWSAVEGVLSDLERLPEPH